MTAPSDASEVERPTLAEARATAEAEWRAMDALLRGLEPGGWSRPTACEPWSVADVVRHVIGQYDGAARPWAMLRRIREARRSWPDLGVLDGQNSVQVAEYADRTPEELLELHAHLAPRAVRALARIPSPVRRTRLSRVFPEAREQPEDSVDFLVRVLASRDAWVHRLDVADATRTPVVAADHDTAQVRQVVRDLGATWVGRQVRLELRGAGVGHWTIGAGEPRALLSADGLDLVRQLAGRPPSGPVDLRGDPDTCRRIAAHRMPF